MTNEQKAVIIATFDGWVEDDNLVHIGKYYKREEYEGYADCLLEHLYLTDLNYLVPVAVKAYQQMESIFTPNASFKQARIYTAILNLGAPPYQPLFDAVYNAIVYLENQNRPCNR